MELKLRENWQDFVTAKQIEKRNKIIERANKTGKLTTTNGQFLVNFDRKVRVCNTCGRTVEEAGRWAYATMDTANGETVSCGLMADCLDCQLKDIISGGLFGAFDDKE